MTPPQPEATPALEVQDVVAGYGGGDVLRGVNLTVWQGGITCVVGPNGAGKSTLLSSIVGLLKPRLGQVTLHGERLTGRSPRQILEAGPRRRAACRAGSSGWWSSRAA
jgi:branched-chain amino acid transport system ATP-binding protein